MSPGYGGGPPLSLPARLLVIFTEAEQKKKLDPILLLLVGHRTAASAGELDTVGGKQEHRNKLNANSCDTVGFGAA